MTRKDFEVILGRVITDREFRKSLAKDPENAVKKYNLTKKEIQVLSSLNVDEKSKEAMRLLDKRISKWPIAGGRKKRW